MIIFGLSLLNGILSLMTFNIEQSRDVSCDISDHRHCIGNKTFGSINNYFFVKIQYISADFLLRVLVNGIAVERTIAVSTGVNFSKQKSKQLAKGLFYLFFF